MIYEAEWCYQALLFAFTFSFSFFIFSFSLLLSLQRLEASFNHEPFGRLSEDNFKSGLSMRKSSRIEACFKFENMVPYGWFIYHRCGRYPISVRQTPSINFVCCLSLMNWCSLAEYHQKDIPISKSRLQYTTPKPLMSFQQCENWSRKWTNYEYFVQVNLCRPFVLICFFLQWYLLLGVQEWGFE